MTNWIWAVLRNNPTMGFYFILGAAIFLGGLMGYLIHFLIIRLTWRSWLPIKQQREMITLKADLLTIQRERNWYQDHYVSSKAIIKACSSLLVTGQEGEIEDARPNKPAHANTDRQNQGRENTTTAKKT